MCGQEGGGSGSPLRPRPLSWRPGACLGVCVCTCLHTRVRLRGWAHTRACMSRGVGVHMCEHSVSVGFSVPTTLPSGPAPASSPGHPPSTHGRAPSFLCGLLGPQWSPGEVGWSALDPTDQPLLGQGGGCHGAPTPASWGASSGERLSEYGVRWGESQQGHATRPCAGCLASH